MKHTHPSHRQFRTVRGELRRILAAQGVVLKKGRNARSARRRTAAYLMDVQDSWSDSAR